MPKCFKCKFNESSVDGLYKHLKFQHKLDKYCNSFSCVDCEVLVTFPSWDRLRRHFNFHHNFPKACAILKCQSSAADDLPNETVPSKKLPIKTFPDKDLENEDCDMQLGLDDESDLANTLTNDSLKSLLEMCGSKLVAKLYAQPGRPRCQVEEFVNHTSEFLNSSVSMVNEIVKSKLVEANVNDAVIQDISGTISILTNPFQKLTSDYLRLKFLKDHGYYIEPDDYTIASDMFSNFSKQNSTWKLKHVKGKFIRLRDVFKSFLELPNVFSTIVEFLDSTPPEGVVSEFIHGPFWQAKKASFEGKIVIPLFYYYDDYEVDKDLGPHSAKLGAIYVKIAALPAMYQASLENIFLLSLFSSQDRVDYCNRAVFKKSNQELNFLQEKGIEITVKNHPVRVYFTIGLVIADNLAMHTLLGLVEGFTANYPCRFCRVHKSVLQYQCEEDPALLRDRIQHELDIHENNVSTTGVNERSVLQDIKGFDPMDNPSVDLLHDFWEGVAIYDINHMLHYFIIEKKFFSVAILNAKMVTFNFGDSVSNKPVQLTEASVKNRSVKMTGNEMRTFIRSLAHLVGEFVPEGDPVWGLYLILRQIVDILLCRGFQVELLDYLDVLISQHHRLYLELFFDTLKPKFHYMLHYSRVLRKSGCPMNFSCDRMESKHQPSVQDAHATTSRKFVAHTLAVKVQLRFAYRVICQKGLDQDFDVGPEVVSELTSALLPEQFGTEYMQHSFVKIYGTKYQEDTCIVIGLDSDYVPIFALICGIFVNSSSEVIFLCNILVTKEFSEHYHSFSVSRSAVTKCFYRHDLKDYHPLMFCTSSKGEHFVTLHHAL